MRLTTPLIQEATIIINTLSDYKTLKLAPMGFIYTNTQI